MRLFVTAAVLVLAAGCSSTSSAADSYTVTPQAQRILSQFWHDQGNYTTKGYMLATCKDLRHGSSPAAEAIALTNAKQKATVADAQSLVTAAIKTVCPKAAKVPAAWR